MSLCSNALEVGVIITQLIVEESEAQRAELSRPEPFIQQGRQSLDPTSSAQTPCLGSSLVAKLPGFLATLWDLGRQGLWLIMFGKSSELKSFWWMNTQTWMDAWTVVVPFILVTGEKFRWNDMLGWELTCSIKNTPKGNGSNRIWFGFPCMRQSSCVDSSVQNIKWCGLFGKQSGNFSKS